MERKDYMKKLSIIKKFTLYGILFGLTFPAGAFLYVCCIENTSILVAQQTRPLLWMIELAPFVLGVAGYLLGKLSANSMDQQQRRMDYVLKKMNVGIWKWDIEKNILKWDDSLYDLYGVNKNNFEGAYDAWEKTLHPDYKESAVKELEDALAGIKEFDATFAILNSKNETQYIGARAKIERKKDGTPYYMYGINFDKTKEYLISKELEEEKVKMLQASKLATLGEMSAGIAHEIKNPLAIIQMSSTIIDKKKDNHEILSKRVSEIQVAVRRITKIIDGLRKFAGKNESIIKESHNVKTILDECLKLSEVRCKTNHIDLRSNEFCDHNISCDDVQIEQILLNLINNAIDANESIESPWIEVSCLCEEKYVSFIVRDSGVGIDSEILEKLFNPFFTTKVGNKGTGLGLSISQSIAKEHDGSLEYKLIDGHTAFVLTIPMLESKAAS